MPSMLMTFIVKHLQDLVLMSGQNVINVYVSAETSIILCPRYLRHSMILRYLFGVRTASLKN